jgi:aldose 1-epimerase
MITKWGSIDGEDVFLFTIENQWGKVSFSEYGAAITELFIKDRSGVLKNVVLGYDNLEGYINGTSFQGATIGRFANRIKGGFTLGGVYYPLDCNDGENCLHGNPGFDKKIWKGEMTGGDGGGDSVTFRRTSPDGESGFPGNLEVSVTFTFKNNALKIVYFAKSDKDTHVSLTNHSYFNLSGDPKNKITDTEFTINGEEYVPGDLPKGYDDNIFLSKTDERIMKTVAVAKNVEKSGIKMSVITDMPAIQFYNCANLDETFRGIKCGPLSAFCLETQFSPDTPNRPDYPSSLLKAGETYDRTTIYQFHNI